MLSLNQIDSQLWELEKACNSSDNKFAVYVLYAVQDYIGTGRACSEFLIKFIAMSNIEIAAAVSKCLVGSLATEDILNKFCKAIHFKKGV